MPWRHTDTPLFLLPQPPEAITLWLLLLPFRERSRHAGSKASSSTNEFRGPDELERRRMEGNRKQREIPQIASSCETIYRAMFGQETTIDCLLTIVTIVTLN